MSNRFEDFVGSCTTATFALTNSDPVTLFAATPGCYYIPLSGHITSNATTAFLCTDTSGVGILSASSAGLQLTNGIAWPHNPHGIGKPTTVGTGMNIASSNASATVTGAITVKIEKQDNA